MKANRAQPPSPARLFAEPERSSEPAGAYLANIDGAARGNPGPASYGVVISRPDGRRLDELARYVGRTTNNVAEYYALIAALDYAEAHGIRKLRVRSDSELLVRQMQGRYKVKSADLRPLHERARKLAARLDFFSIQYIPRAENQAADRLANQALDRTAGSPDRSTGDEGFQGTQMKASRANPQPQERRLRACYRNGTLYPAEPLDLPDGAEVEVRVRLLPRS